MKTKYTENDYIEKCNQLNLIYKGHHKHPHKGTMIDFLCIKHKNKGVQSSTWSHFKNAAKGCSYCSGRHKTTDEFKLEMSNINPTIQIDGEYSGSEGHVDCTCLICGNKWSPIARSLKNGQGCMVCGRERIRLSRLKTNETFIEELKDANPDIVPLSDYIGTHKKITMKCKICDNVWDSYPANLLNKSCGCPYCNISNGEREMLNVLKDLNITYIPQFPIWDKLAKRRNPLKFDAYSTELNIAFEFNGEQHYRPVDFASAGNEWAKSQFEITKNRDLRKKNYCIEHNIKMVIIPYYEKDNMKNIILNSLKEDNIIVS